MSNSLITLQKTLSKVKKKLYEQQQIARRRQIELDSANAVIASVSASLERALKENKQLKRKLAQANKELETRKTDDSNNIAE